MIQNDHLKAINPDTGKLVNVHEFIRDVGINYKAMGKAPVCPSCKKEMKVYGYTSIELTTRFMHVNDSTHCSLSTSSKRHNIFQKADYDHSKGLTMRNSFCDKDVIADTYAVAHALCNKRLTIAEFHLMIMIADRRDLWSLYGLTLDILPYLLVLLIDFKKDTKRNYSYRFVLNKPKMREVDSLWAQPHDCFLTKIHIEGYLKGKKVRHKKTKKTMKWSILDEKYESVRLNHQWIIASHIDKLMKYC